MRKHLDWEDYKKTLLADPEFKAVYDRSRPAAELAHMLLGARIELDLTQAELAERLGMKQSTIARIENMDGNPTLATISRITNHLGKKLTFS